MTQEETIKKAIEGGYKLPGFLDSEQSYKHIVHWYSGEKHAMINLTHQPLFWRCLIKGGGWSEKLGDFPIWLHLWHSFIDHLSKGKDAESFFEKL